MGFTRTRHTNDGHSILIYWLTTCKKKNTQNKTKRNPEQKNNNNNNTITRDSGLDFVAAGTV
jgi:hypothetical protein